MSKPQLTPGSLFSGKQLPPHWTSAKLAFICFTPFPAGFQKYVIEVSSERYFLHSPATEVRLCCSANIYFIVISEVYGFEVGSTTVEELVYYGIDDIIGIGYVGAFNGASFGQRFIATAAMSDQPMAMHYGIKEFSPVYPNPAFYHLLSSLAGADGVSWDEYTVWCTNSIYREYPSTIRRMKEKGCDVVNMDTLAIYAVAPVCAREAGKAVRYIYVGTIADAQSSDGEGWDSDLIETITDIEEQPHDKLVQFMIEQVLPRLYESWR